MKKWCYVLFLSLCVGYAGDSRGIVIHYPDKMHYDSVYALIAIADSHRYERPYRITLLDKILLPLLSEQSGWARHDKEIKHLKKNGNCEPSNPYCNLISDDFVVLIDVNNNLCVVVQPYRKNKYWCESASNVSNIWKRIDVYIRPSYH